MWEKFNALLRKGTENQTMSEETDAFLKKMKELSNIWEALQASRDIGDDLKEKLLHLTERGTIISDNVKLEGSLNAGGKFEWVDSILIKCLQEGTWLLVDNVNLCSPAVLDRLNALLEPNGVLTIGERGVDKDGKMIEITPHPDFRLFLTMDSKNGEISRAMRNRGVEIYILNDKECGRRNEFDIKSLIDHEGLNNINHINALLAIHDFICDSVLGEKPQLSNLLQASFLISQQLLRGINIYTAFTNTILDVYLNCKSTSEFSQSDPKKSLTEEVIYILNKQLIPEKDVYDTNLTLKTKNLEVNSSITKIEQQLVSFSKYLGKCSEDPEKYAMMTQFFFMHFSTITSGDDLELRHIYLKNILKDEKYKLLASSIMNEIRKLNFKTHKPIDFKWLPDTIYEEKDLSAVNKLFILIFFISNVALYENTEMKKKGAKEFTLLQYLMGVKNKQIDMKVDDPVLDNLLDLIVNYDSYIYKLLNLKIYLSNELTVQVISLLRWRFVLHNYLNIKLKQISDIGDILNNLHVHYKWFNKYSINHLNVLLDLHKFINMDEIKSIIYKINSNLTDQFSILKKIGKHYQKTIDTPPPLVSDDQLLNIPMFYNFINNYELYNKNNDFKSTINIMLNDNELKPVVISLQFEKVLELTQTLTTHKTEIKTTDVIVLPIIDYFYVRQIHKLRHNINGNNENLFNNTITVPLKLLTVLSRFNETKDLSLLHEIKTEINFYLRNAACVAPNNFIRFGDEAESTDSIVLALHTPVLTFLVSDLLIDTVSSNFVTPTRLGKYRDAIQLHRKMNLVLWKNMQQLADYNYDYMYCEIKYLQNSYTEFMSKFSTSLGIVDIDDLIQSEVILKCINKIEELYRKSDIIDENNDSSSITILLMTCFEEITKLELDSRENIKLNCISNVYITLNYLKSLLNSKLPIVDPLTKVTLKKKYCSEETTLFQCLKESFVLQNSIYSDNDETLSPFCGIIDEKIVDLDEKHAELGKYVAVRPDNISYQTVTKIISHGFATVLSPNRAIESCETMNNAINNLEIAISRKTKIKTQHAQKALNLSVASVHSYDSFINNIKQYRYVYPDVIEPLLSNVVELLYGVNLKISLLKKLIMKYEHLRFDIDLSIDLIDLIKFPLLNEKHVDYTQTVDQYVGDKMHNFITHTFDDTNESNIGKQENFRLLKCCIIEISNICKLDAKYSQTLDKELFKNFDNLIKMFVSVWKKQVEDQATKQNEEESLYKMKTKCDDKTEDQQIEEEFKKLFPSYHDEDFPDLRSSDLDDDPIDIYIIDEYSGLIKFDDVQFVADLHSEFVTTLTKTEWLHPAEHKDTYNCELLKPLMHKFKLFKLLLNKSMDALSYKADNDLLGALNVMVSIAQKFGDVNLLDENSTPSKTMDKYNYYKDPNVVEVKGCYHVLEELKSRIDNLLQQWPEHPTLKTISSIIERIYNFDITSPLPRFLTGFDILLTKCHEWEENAHSGVSLVEHSLNISRQIVTWRQLEMKKWKNALDNSYNRLIEPVSKHWFYIYDIMEEYINKKEILTAELISTLQKFILQSNIVEFESRLELLLTFHCHATYLTITNERDIFISVLWNLYHYYRQFVPNILEKMKTLRTPIEKKLKDYIKIIRWKDISYYAIKEMLDKTHKMVHKYMREYEDVLKQPCSPLLINTTSQQELVGFHDRPQRRNPKSYHYTLEPDMYTAKLHTFSHDEMESGILAKTEKYFKKSRSLCAKAIASAQYPKYIKDLDCFITEVIETSTHLQGLEVDSTLPKPKQVSSAKSHLRQKQRALADLFKTLSKIGLSFRAGIIESKRKDISSEFVIKPIDISASISYIPQSRNDDKILSLWDGVEVYYRKSLMRLEILESSTKNPAKDLGMQNIERVNGFGAHLMMLAQTQKNKLTESTNILYQLRYYQMNLTEQCEHDDLVHINKLFKIKSVLKNTILTLQQYKIIHQTCPEASVFNEDIVEIPVLSPENKHFIQSKFDPAWNLIFGHYNNIINIAEKILYSLKKIKHTIPSNQFILEHPKYVHVNNLSQIIIDLNTITGNINEITSVFGQIPLMESIRWVNNEIEDSLSYLTQDIEEANLISVDVFKKDVEKLTENILVVIQNVHKKYSEVKKDSKELEIEEGAQLDDLLLTGLVIDNILADIDSLDGLKLVKSVRKIATAMGNLNSNDSIKYKAVLRNVLPLLEQLILLYQFFITQQVSAYRVTCKMSSILLNIFIELATKGFCIPPELSADMEGESNQSSGGMGLGDGEGEKDVSDKIESEDQLDDAQPAGQEKQKEEDKDCKEEDKGIEMSEDFDSKLQDLEKKEDDEEDDKDNNSDAEEQMGDTEKGADQLDKEVWGSDDEEPPEQEGEEKTEEKGDKGEKEGEQELTAKDAAAQNEDEKDDQNSKEENKENEKNKKDINDMEEPEFDDEQTDPYHGNQPELPEPEPMDLPDDMQLDDDEDNAEQQDENPFDIDAIKEDMPPPEDKSKEEENKTEDVDENKDADGDSSEDDDPTSCDKQMETDVEEEEDNKADNDGLDQKPEEVNEPDKQVDESDKSALDETQTSQDEVQAMDVENIESADNVQTNPTKDQKSSQPNEDVCQEDNPDKEGVGKSQMEDSSTGHKGQANAQQDSQNSRKEDKQQQKRQKPGETDSERSLGDNSEPLKKKLKAMNIESNEDSNEPEEDGAEKVEKDADMYQHIKDAKESSDQMLDSATREQAETQKEVPSEDENLDKPTESSELLPEENEEEVVELMETSKQKAEKLDSDEKKKGKDQAQHPDGDILEEMKDIEIEGEVINTQSVPRGGETTHHTQFGDTADKTITRLSVEDINQLRLEVEQQLSVWNEPPTSIEAEQAWEKISSVTSTLAQNLSEQLRLVLEPTQASRLKGDFRTGRRINMRKVIPYIASQFRKDKIWLRRTKPSKREYQIVLAIDDSSSMADNHSKELAFESVALISKALTLLESGQLSILSFGEGTEVLHKLTDTFTEKSGSKLLQKFQFDQKKTNVAKLVDFATEMLNTSHSSTNALIAKLLIIVSDGRGIFSEGESFVQQAVRRAKLSNIFMVFVIVDNPENSSSILDIRKPIFHDGKVMEIKSYMDTFPFPFYIILRDINSLPNVLSDALRQWFEIVSNVDKQ